MELAKLAKAMVRVEKALEKEGLAPAYELNKMSIRDDQAPVVTVECKIRKHWKPVDLATLDGGAGVNIISRKWVEQCEMKYVAAPFKLRMADQSVTEPIGLVPGVMIKVGGVKFDIPFLVLDVGDSYGMLLGRPWLRAAGAVHDWGTDELTMNIGNKKVTISTSAIKLEEKKRPIDLFLTEDQETWKKLEASNIVPVATMDLN